VSAPDRRLEIERGLGDVRRRIDEACASVGRAADDVTLVVVTKFFPASDVRILADLGVTDIPLLLSSPRTPIPSEVPIP
jgi:hypothetical protein